LYVNYFILLILTKCFFFIKISTENFDAILKELGVNKVLRTLAKTLKPRVTINEKDGKWSFKSETTFKTTSYQFQPGVQFEDTTPDGQIVQVFFILFLFLFK
jgi:hypothetical protein